MNKTLIYNVSEHDFHQKVIDRSFSHSVMVDFWAEWCAPCIAVAPVLEAVVQELNGKILLAKVEVDYNMRLAGHYRIRGFPTLLLFQRGVECARFSGARSKHWILDFLDQHLSAFGRTMQI